MVFRYEQQDDLHVFTAISLHDAYEISPQEIKETVSQFKRHAGAPKEGLWNCWIERRQQLTVEDGEFKLDANSEELYNLQIIIFVPHLADQFKTLFLPNAAGWR